MAFDVALEGKQLRKIAGGRTAIVDNIISTIITTIRVMPFHSILDILVLFHVICISDGFASTIKNVLK